MSADQISLDPEALAAHADAWDKFADDLQQYLASSQPDLQQLSAQLGPLYDSFIQAKTLETAERGQAYQRMIDWARSHAQKMRHHRVGLEGADDDVARGITNAVQS
ncbi:MULTISPECIES: type VII secretion target [Mycolicibacterium]|uniref:type VII secretion target n=1 Tax=Mycolicibacterium TaxID=1866885 RepID=UPI00093C2809|nr:hypothetical protein [Mycolicibacterium goodii]MBU8841250.1 hypothetical protein [Mycolicibacterium goodii]OKH68309.1 hypothetical protein EB74_33590 [Mycobacterium sp. SWH-M5]